MHVHSLDLHAIGHNYQKLGGAYSTALGLVNNVYNMNFLWCRKLAVDSYITP